MPVILCNGLEHYYEQRGHGPAVIFIHGAFGDCRLWQPQWEHFASGYRLIRYDLRGHGKTGASQQTQYRMETYADDLAALMDGLGIESAVLCGLSWGGSIAQVFAVRYPQRARALILAGATVSMSLTWNEKLLRYVLVPRRLMLWTIRSLGVEHFVRFSFWLAGLTLGRGWLHGEPRTLHLMRDCMLQIEAKEYEKIWDAIYHFDLQPLETIRCPTLVVVGEGDARMVRRHAEEIVKRVPGAQRRLLPAASHALTLEQPQAFNQAVDEFLASLMPR